MGVRTLAKRLGPVLLALAACALSGCVAAFVPEHQETPPAAASVVIEITGSPGLTFEGSIGTAPSTKSIAGQVPAQYTVETAIGLAVSVTKKGEDGDLTVRILRAGKEVSRRSTSSPYGTVLLVYAAR
jgi:hypothetical protein